MANLSLNQNQTFQTTVIGMVTNDPQPNTFSAQIYPSSTATVITAGQAVKLVDASGPNIIVDVTTSASDGPVFGFIPFKLRKNTYAAGDTVEVVGRNGVLMLKSSAQITRGQAVAVTNQTVSTDDPTVAYASTVGYYVAGVAITPASAANQLLKVQVSPGIISATGVISVTP